MRRAIATFVVAAVGVALLALPAGGSSLLPVVTVAKNGHRTHPAWYHDTTVARSGKHLFLAWNTDAGSVKIRDWNLGTSAWRTKRIRISTISLDCGCTDSTGTNPNRHDVPTIFADSVGRVYAFYGGGTASKIGPQTGPWFRTTSGLQSITSWGPEQRLPIPGAAYDLEAVRDRLGWTHLIGQQGDNPSGAGSIVYVRVPPGTSSAPATPDPYRILVRGGDDPAACNWLPIPGCNIFVIGRIAVGPPDLANPTAPSPLVVVWGWSEQNLSGTCADPSGFCNRGLYLAQSFDGGNHWTNAAGTASVDLATGSIAYDDSRFMVVDPATNVGVFKGLAITGSYPGTPWLAYQPGANIGAGQIDVTSWGGSSWTTPTVVDSTRAWNNHLVMRSFGDGSIALWSDVAQTGSHSNEIVRWARSPSGGWSKRTLSVGPNWFLTGRPINGSTEALVWRAPGTAPATEVRFVLAPGP